MDAARYKNRNSESIDMYYLFVWWATFAWFTHVFTCLDAESWGFLIAGAIFFPVAIVHGTGIWFGFF